MSEKIIFLRFGGLSSVKQKHYLPEHSKDKSFHNPPRKRGIYAFPQNCVDKFLLGATSHPTQKNAKAYWVKDENGNLVSQNELGYNDDGEYVPSKKLKRILKYRKIKLTDVYYQQKRYISYEERKADDYEDTEKYYLTTYVKPKIFKYEGEIWHHFLDETKPGEILDRSGDWILSTYKDYCKIFKRTKHKDLSQIHEMCMEFSDTPLRFNEIANKVYRYSGGLSMSIDHLEVFIEKV